LIVSLVPGIKACFIAFVELEIVWEFPAHFYPAGKFGVGLSKTPRSLRSHSCRAKANPSTAQTVRIY